MKRLLTMLAAFSLCFVLLGCSSRAPLTLEALQKAAEATGMEYTEEDAATLGVAGSSASATATLDTASARVMLLTSDADARTLYANIVSTLDTIEGTKTNVDSSTYNKLYIQSDAGFYAVIRINSSLFFGADQGDGKTEALIKAMGY